MNAVAGAANNERRRFPMRRKIRNMSCCIIRKVPVKVGNRIVWGLVLCEREGVALMVVQRMGKNESHSLVVGSESANGIFESVSVNRFPLEHGDLAELGRKLHTIGDELDEDAFYRFLKLSDDDWWKDL
jgi:hypothetical protein